MPLLSDDAITVANVVLTDQGSTPATPASGKTRIFTKSDGLYVVDDAGGVTGPLGAGGGGLGNYVHIQERQTSGTNGGTFTSGSWQKRVLNQEVADTGSDASLSSGAIVLAAGTYRFRGWGSACAVSMHQVRLYDTTGAAVLGLGETAYAAVSGDFQSSSSIQGRFTIGVTSTLEFQHQCYATKATYGLGVAAGFGTDEVYADIELWKEA